MAQHTREFTREDGLRVRVLRSSRRTRTVSAAWRDGTAVVSIPARLSLAEEEDWVAKMLERMLSRRARTPAGDAELLERCLQLSKRYLGGRAVPTSVRWVDNQQRRWASATALDGTIRVSRRVRDMPGWVIDYVLVHELAHLLADDGHGPVFKSFEASYPRRLEAQAFLAGVSWATDVAAPGATPGPAPEGWEPL
ncbi:MAG: DUF45 domain-containing protein [Arthrobacter sp.]|jgi:predicted metal-dependent hydrolase|nr:DUF45 domain-containing protein [Arthrobacter sp.]